jgi:hypothetical protein
LTFEKRLRGWRRWVSRSRSERIIQCELAGRRNSNEKRKINRISREKSPAYLRISSKNFRVSLMKGKMA